MLESPISESVREIVGPPSREDRRICGRDPAGKSIPTLWFYGNYKAGVFEYFKRNRMDRAPSGDEVDAGQEVLNPPSD